MTCYLATCLLTALTLGTAFAQPTPEQFKQMEEKMELLWQQSVRSQRLEQEIVKENNRMRKLIVKLETDNEAWKETMNLLKTEVEEQKSQLQEQNIQLQEQKIQLQEQKTDLVKQNERISELERELQLEKEPRKRAQVSTMQVSTPKGKLLSKNKIKDVAKRSDDIGALEPVVAQMTQRLNDISAEIQALKDQDEALKSQDTALKTEDEALKNALQVQNQARGTTYVRWGQAACPNSSETVYSGFIGGSLYQDYGAAVNYLCLPPDPTFDQRPAGLAASDSKSGVWGAEYEVAPDPEYDMNAVCSVCRSSRSTVVMVPATNVCNSGWHLEYSGYLMAGWQGHHAASEYICVDKIHGYIPGTKSNDNGKLLYYTIVHCGSLSCPPYAEGKFIRCAVCSK